MGMMHNRPKWWKSKRSKRQPTHKIPSRSKRGTSPTGCLHKGAHKIHSGELYCPRCRLVVGYDKEDR